MYRHAHLTVNDGSRLRGHQFTDAAGAFEFETVKPKDYHNFGLHRTPHVHVKLQGRDTKLLTTQLYFPNEPLNAHDCSIATICWCGSSARRPRAS